MDGKVYQIYMKDYFRLPVLFAPIIRFPFGWTC